MGKKTFLNNPAMQFISKPEEEAAPAPAAPAEEIRAQAPEKPPKGYRVNPEYIEVKSRRLQLVMRPSLYDKVKKAAKKKKLSVNEYIHGVLEAAIEKEEG